MTYHGVGVRLKVCEKPAAIGTEGDVVAKGATATA